MAHGGVVSLTPMEWISWPRDHYQPITLRRKLWTSFLRENTRNFISSTKKYGKCFENTVCPFFCLKTVLTVKLNGRWHINLRFFFTVYILSWLFEVFFFLSVYWVFTLSSDLWFKIKYSCVRVAIVHFVAPVQSPSQPTDLSSCAWDNYSILLSRNSFDF